MNSIKELSQQGKTIIITSHKKDIMENSSRTIWLEQGKIKEQGETKTITSLYFQP